jgi:hypothetical protein
MEKFKIRASSGSKITGGVVGLSDSQEKKYRELADRERDAVDGIDGVKPLTSKMTEELNKLQELKDNPVLPKTLTTFCETWIKEKVYNRRKEFTSKYTEKGNIMEDEAISVIADKFDLMLIKNDEFFENEYFTGTPDVITDNIIFDIKCPFDCFTFPLFMEEPPDEYYAQAQVYMELTGVKKFCLCYVLTDTPSHIIEREAMWFARNNGYGELEDNEDILQEFKDKMTYGEIPDELKIKVFDFEYDPEYIKELHKRVDLCREYIDEKIKEL